MNILDEILKELTKECEKERNSHKDYSSQENLKNKINIKELPKQNNFDTTFHFNLSDKVEKEKTVIDNRKDLNKNDVVRIIGGDYKALSDKECKFLEYCKGMDKVLLQLDELNPLYVNPEDIKLVKKAKEKHKVTIFNRIENKNEDVIVEIENDMLTVILQNGIKSTIGLNNEDRTAITTLNCYYDAKIKQYLNAKQCETFKNNCLKFD